MGKRKKDIHVDLLGTIEVLHRHLTESLCEEAYRGVRQKERQREWTLTQLAAFWTAVILRAPPSLTQALQEASGSAQGIWPKVQTTSQAFFSRCEHLSWKFFKALYESFVPRVLADETPSYAASFHPLLARFTHLWIIDGSRLDKIAHRLKILWDERSVILPGCLTVCYDVFYGVSPVLRFYADAAAAEFHRAQDVLSAIPRGTLLLGDRLYCSVQWFHALTQNGIYGVFRRNKRLTFKKLRRLSRKRLGSGLLEDTLIEAGCGVGSPSQVLRRIRWKNGGRVREVFTNVLDPLQLSAEEALALYPLRWNIERMFFDLKEVLNLHRFYAANPNAVAMQVYAGALVYTAMRMAQAHVARRAGIPPEAISTEKFFPRVAAASVYVTNAELAFIATCRANPRHKLLKPDWGKLPFARTALWHILVQKRLGKRRKRRFCVSRGRWKSLAHVSGIKI